MLNSGRKCTVPEPLKTHSLGLHSIFLCSPIDLLQPSVLYLHINVGLPGQTSPLRNPVNLSCCSRTFIAQGGNMTQSHTLSRRSFLQTLLSGAGGYSVLALAVPLDLQTPSATKLRNLSMDSFASKLNGKFQVYTSASSGIKMTLIAVTDLRTSQDQHGEVFSLLFETTSSQQLPQGTYTFKKAGMGKFDMFIVPATSDGSNSRYEALFNRYVPN
jgi:hypothetical protein